MEKKKTRIKWHIQRKVLFYSNASTQQFTHKKRKFIPEVKKNQLSLMLKYLIFSYTTSHYMTSEMRKLTINLLGWCKSNRGFALLNFAVWYWNTFLNKCDYISGVFLALFIYLFFCLWLIAATAAAKSLQSCPTPCDPTDCGPPGSSVPGILQARILEWVAISFSNAWKWKVKVKLLSHAWLLVTPWTRAYQALPSMGFSRQEYWSGVPLPSPMTHYLLFILYLF